MPNEILPSSQYGLIRYPQGQGDLYKHPVLDAPPEDEEQQAPDVEYPPEMVALYRKLHGRVKRLKETWCGEITEVQTRRDIRKIKVDVEQERAKGNIGQDETLVPSRVAHDNIEKEKPQFINYLTSSRKIANFCLKDEALEENGVTVEPLEDWFTKKFRYPGWEIPQYKTIDGCQMHGCDYVEIIVDKSKPGFFAIEHIARENCWYPTDVEDLQDCHTLVRNTRISEHRLRKFKDVIVAEVDKLFDNKDSEGTSPKDTTESLQEAQKVFYRKGDTVYVCWMSVDKGSYFLREPKPLFHGAKYHVIDPMTGVPISSTDVFENAYPVIPLPYTISENGKLKEISGRIFFDEYIQEAITSVLTALVNSWLKASEVYGCPDDKQGLDGDGSASIKQTESPIIGGTWVNRPARFFHKPYPDASGMALVEALLTLNKQEAGSQVNYAALNREDSRKTAREVSAAMNQAALLSTVTVTLFSIYMRGVLNRCWKISQNYVKSGELKVPQHLLQYFQYEYELASAGDTEVIQREETLNRLLQIYPALQSFPMASMVVLEDILTLSFPKQGRRYVQALRQGNQQQSLVDGMKQIIQQIVAENPEVMQRLDPESQQSLQFLLSQASATQPNGQPQQPNQPSAQAQPAKQPPQVASQHPG